MSKAKVELQSKKQPTDKRMVREEESESEKSIKKLF
jgi:hypothetical protein